MGDSISASRIGRREAATILGVTTQTVSNLAKRGALAHSFDGKRHYYSRDEVLALVPKVETVRNTEAAIAEIEHELASRCTELATELELSEARRDFINRIADTSSFYRYHRLVEATYRAVEATAMLGSKLTSLEREVLEQVLNFRPIGEIAMRYGLTKERIRQILERALRRMEHYAFDVGENFRRLRDGLGTTKEEVAKLSKDILALEKENAALKHEIQLIPSNLFERRRILATKIEDLDLTVRLKNCCRRVNIVTVSDLVSKRRNDLMKIRNFGARCMREVDDFVRDNNLWFGMLNEQKEKEKC